MLQQFPECVRDLVEIHSAISARESGSSVDRRDIAGARCGLAGAAASAPTATTQAATMCHQSPRRTPWEISNDLLAAA